MSVYNNLHDHARAQVMGAPAPGRTGAQLSCAVMKFRTRSIFSS